MKGMHVLSGMDKLYLTFDAHVMLGYKSKKHYVLATIDCKFCKKSGFAVAFFMN